MQLACDASDRPRLHATFKLAVDSISKYPLPLRSAAEAGELVGVGDFIAHRIGYILRQQVQQQGRKGPAAAAAARAEGEDGDVTGAHGSSELSRTGASGAAAGQLERPVASGAGGSTSADGGRPEGKSRRYSPKEGSTASQLLLALSSLLLTQTASASAAGQPATATLAAVLRQAAASFVDNRTSNSVNAKAALKRLAVEGLIVRQSADEGGGREGERLSCTHLGTAVAKEMDCKRRDTSDRSSAVASAGPSSTHHTVNTPPASSDCLASPGASAPALHCLHPFSLFTLHLAVDSRERRLHGHAQLPPATVVRPLPAGDFIWLLRHTDSGVEYVVDLIVERKRVSDLVTSVKDGRMREQRWRMKRSGLTRKLYIIEGDIPSGQAAATAHEPAVRFSLPLSTLESVLSSVSVVHGYSVVRTGGVSWTVALLGQLHRQLETELSEEGVLLSERYSHFEERMKKRGGGGGGAGVGEQHAVEEGAGDGSEEVEKRQVWGSQLRMIRGVSPMIAASIVAHYPSLATLQRAYSECVSSPEEETLLAEVTFGQRNQRVGVELSRRVREVLRLDAYDVAVWEQCTADRKRDAAEQKKRLKEKRDKTREDDRLRRKRERDEHTNWPTSPRRKRPAVDGHQQQQQQLSEKDEERREGEGQGELLQADRKRQSCERADTSARPQPLQPLGAGRDGKKPAMTAAAPMERVDVDRAADGSDRGDADWQHPQRAAEDESVLRAMRERVQRVESEARREQSSLVAAEADADSIHPMAGGGRKLTAAHRLRRRELLAATEAKRTHPRRGVIHVDGDGGEEQKEARSGVASTAASDDDDEVQCWMADALQHR